MFNNALPFTVGIEAEGGTAWPLIPSGTSIPTSKRVNLTTVQDNQTRMEFHVIQGESPMAADNLTLGRFTLDGILPAPRGIPQIQVAFAVDANGILQVRVQDKNTGKEQKITITTSGSLSKDEVWRVKREAEIQASENARKCDEPKEGILYKTGNTGFKQIT